MPARIPQAIVDVNYYFYEKRKKPPAGQIGTLSRFVSLHNKGCFWHSFPGSVFGLPRGWFLLKKIEHRVPILVAVASGGAGFNWLSTTNG
jgi:hypothetical protein